MANCGKIVTFLCLGTLYFYNHLRNYTKTIIRLRLVNIGEYLTIILRPRIGYLVNKPLQAAGMLADNVHG